MGLDTTIRWARWMKTDDAKRLHAGRLHIGPRLILGFAFIILTMLAADAIILWQFHQARIQTARLTDIDRKLVVILRVHTSMLVFHDRLDEFADEEDADRLLKEAGPLRSAVLEDIRRATSILNLPPFDPRRDPTILPTLHVIQSSLLSELDAITTLAQSGDWRAVHLRLAQEVRPLESLTSDLVEKVDREVSEQQAESTQNMIREERLVFTVVPLTAIFTLLIAATLGLAITRSITKPLARLVDASKALARGQFEHQVSISGEDELAELGHVFNNTSRHLHDLYATLQSSEDRLRLVIDTIPAYAWSARPDGSVDFINQRFLEFTGRSVADIPGWDWRSFVHPHDLAKYLGSWKAAIATGEPMESEARVLRRDGEYRWLLIRSVPLRDERGNIVQWYATSIDIEERHRAEDALRRSEVYLAEAQRLSLTGSFGWKPSTGDLVWSEETFRIFQYDPSLKPTLEVISQRVHPDDRTLVHQTIERATQDGKDFELEHRLQMPDGSVKHVHVVAHALNDKSGVIEFVGALMDITAAKQVEQTLRENEAYLAEAQRLSHTGSGAWRVPGWEALYLSEEWYRIYGFDPQRGLSAWQDRLQRMHPDDRAMVEEVKAQAIRAKSGYEVDHRIILPDGTLRHTHTVGHPVLNAAGEVEQFVCTMMDISERKRAEALRDAEIRILEMIARDAPLEQTLEKLVCAVEAQFAGLLCSVLLLDEDGQHVRHGAAPSLPKDYVEAINGLSIGPKAGSCGTAMYRKETVVVADILQDPLWEEYRGIAQLYGLRACSSTPILSHSGKALGSFALYYREPHTPCEDEVRALEMATHLAGIAIERKQAREERERLRQAQADLAHLNRVATMGELTASLAHEVNQPIAATVTDANTCLRWLARDRPDLEEARAAALRVIKDTTRAGDIIHRIRSLFKKEISQHEWIDVNEIIRGMIELLCSEATRYSIVVRTELAQDLPQILGDRVQLQQVLMNLMINSIEAMKDIDQRRELTIKTQRGEGERLMVSVSDTGVGLPPQKADQIFNSFFTTKRDGTGMGLRIGRSIVESHGGRLWAIENPPRGATFQFTLPVTVEVRR